MYTFRSAAMTSSTMSVATSTTALRSSMRIVPMAPRAHAQLVRHRAHEVARGEPHVPAPADLDRRHGNGRFAIGPALPPLRRPLVRSRVRRRTFEDGGNLRLDAARPAVGLLHRRRRDVQQVELLGERLDDDAERVEVAGDDASRAATARVSSRRRARRSATVGTGAISIFCLVTLLDVAQQAMLARLGERDRDALAPGAARAADAVDVRLGGDGHVVVHDVRDVLRCRGRARRRRWRSSRSVVAGAELPHHAVALLLRQPAVQRLGAIAAARSASRSARPPRCACGRRRSPTSGSRRRARGRAPPILCARGDDVRDLPHARRVARRHALASDATRTGSSRCVLRDRGDARRQRGGEERRLPLGGRRLEDRLEVLGEAHVEHLVRLVEHDDLDASRARSVSRRMWSSARPGVATTTSTPRLSARSCVLHRLRRRRSAAR